MSLPRTLIRLVGAGLGVPAAALAVLVGAAPWFLGGAALSAEDARAFALRGAADAMAAMGCVVGVAAAFVARGMRPGAALAARRELVVVPRAISFAWIALAATAFVAGAGPWSPPQDPRGTVAVVAAAVMAIASVGMHPALRRAMRDALRDARLAEAPASWSERLAVRTAVAVGVPCGAAALLAVLVVAAQGRDLAAAQGARAAATWSALLTLPAVEGEAPGGPVLAARVLAAGGALAPRDERPSPLPSRAWAVLVALAAGVLGAAIGRRVGRDAAAALTLATGRIRALTEGKAIPPWTPHAETAPDVRELVDALDALARKLAAMAADHRRSLSARRETARLRSLVFAGVSHDLRGPLNAVLGFAGILEGGVDGPLADGQRESVDAVTRGGRDLLRLVDDLLDAARIEAERMTVDPVPTPLAEVIAAAADDARARLASADVSALPFALETSTDVTVLADPARTARALGALLAYAQLRPGAALESPVSLRVARADGARVTLRIHGPGSSPTAEVLAQVFEPFDLPPPGARARAGIGLAAGVGHRVLALQGGGAEASAAPEGGLLFTAHLPRAG